MTNKFMYFIANWKMFGDIKSLNSLNKVLKFSRNKKNNKFRLIYCPPYTLRNLFHKKIKNSNIELGAQNCHEEEVSGPFTCLLYTSPSPRDATLSRMPSSA